MNIPIFPLQLIIFPGEHLNLHIFEKRYRDLFNDLKNQEILYFGIPPVVDNQIHTYGTRLILTDIEKTYPGGELDVKTKGLDVFKINQLANNYEQKDYASADIELLIQDSKFDFTKFEQLKSMYLEFQALMVEQKVIDHEDMKIYSFQIAHYIGLSEGQKLLLLETVSEEDRQMLLIDHLEMMIPSMKNINETQARITANGHFKNLQTFNFNKPE
jgi:ATP-dependent Lon protease